MKSFIKKSAIFIMAISLVLVGVLQISTFSEKLSSRAVEQYTAKSALLMDYGTGQVLFDKNSAKHLPIASMTKLMTILLTLENIDSGNLALDKKLVASANASSMGGSQVFLDANAEYTVEELLKSTIISSANDASVALAENIAGSESEFVAQMNARAKELGMNDTNYLNCTGLPEANHYSCARDVALVTKELLKHKIYYNYSGIWMDKLVHPSGRETELVNTNRLVKYYKGCDGGKTGSTSEAKYCVSATAEKGGLRLISVVIGAETGPVRFSEAASLLDYGFANFESTKVFEKGQVLDAFEMPNGQIKSISPIIARDSFVLNKKSGKSKIETKIEYMDLELPIKANQKIGVAYVLRNNIVVDEIDILSPLDVAKMNLYDGIKGIMDKWAI